MEGKRREMEKNKEMGEKLQTITCLPHDADLPSQHDDGRQHHDRQNGVVHQQHIAVGRKEEEEEEEEDESRKKGEKEGDGEERTNRSQRVRFRVSRWQ